MKRLLLGLLVLVPAVAQGDTDGLDLLNDCKAVQHNHFNSMNERDHYNFCFGYLMGVFESSPAAIDARTCWPEKGTKVEQMARIVVKYLSGKPKILHRPGYELAINAWADAFPCPKTTILEAPAWQFTPMTNPTPDDLDKLIEDVRAKLTPTAKEYTLEELKKMGVIEVDPKELTPLPEMISVGEFIPPPIRYYPPPPEDILPTYHSK